MCLIHESCKFILGKQTQGGKSLPILDALLLCFQRSHFSVHQKIKRYYMSSLKGFSSSGFTLVYFALKVRLFPNKHFKMYKGISKAVFINPITYVCRCEQD